MMNVGVNQSVDDVKISEAKPQVVLYADALSDKASRKHEKMIR